FQDAERVIVRTRFFREIGEMGWLVEFSSVEKPFLLEAADVPVGTEIEVKLRGDKETTLSPAKFIEAMKEFFLYIDETVRITPDPHIARTLTDAPLLERERQSRLLVRDQTTLEHVGPYASHLRCLFGFGFKKKAEDDRPPASFLLVSNAGVRVFEQKSLRLKPGKRYVLMNESNDGHMYEAPDQHGLEHYWVVVD